MTSRLIARLTFRSPPPVVGVIRLTGVIGQGGMLRSGLNLETVAPSIERAFRLPGLKAIALLINSPGGSPAQSALIQRRIRDLALEKEVPVMAFVEDVAASGGYWLACAADEIFVNDNSILGSIGVISASFGFTDAIEKLGIERRLHTMGAKKSLLDPFKPERPEDVARLEDVQRQIHDNFKDLVRTRRGQRLRSGAGPAEPEEIAAVPPQGISDRHTRAVAFGALDDQALSTVRQRASDAPLIAAHRGHQLIRAICKKDLALLDPPGCNTHQRRIAAADRGGHLRIQHNLAIGRPAAKGRVKDKPVTRKGRDKFLLRLRPDRSGHQGDGRDRTAQRRHLVQQGTSHSICILG